MVTSDDPRYTHIPVEEATKARPGVFQVFVDYWWIVVDGCILMYRGRSPQCNANKELAEAIQKRLHPAARVVRLEVVYVPIERGEY